MEKSRVSKESEEYKRGYKRAEEELIGNIELGNQKFFDLEKRFEKSEEMLEKTEKDRLQMLNENLKMKKELGKLIFVKTLMEQAKIYGYADFLDSLKKK